MGSQSTSTSRQNLLRAQEIRELIRDAHGAFAPDHVARALRDRYMEPFEEDAQEITELLSELVTTARARIEEAEIEPLFDEKNQPSKLTKRERESVANLAMLLATCSMTMLFAGRRDEALAMGLEGLAWARTSRDYVTQTLQWMALYVIYERLGKFDEELGALRRSIETARASGSATLIVEATLPLVSHLIETAELDEGERLNMEVRAILQNDLREEERHPHYAISLAYAARIARHRGRDSECIQGLREALRWADRARYPLTRSSILSQLGSSYIRLEQYRQCIECQREMVQLAGEIGLDKIKGWAYVNLAQAHRHLKEFDQALELLDHAERLSSSGPMDQYIVIAMRRADVLLAAERFDEAAVLCRQIVDHEDQVSRTLHLRLALRMLGEIDEKGSRYESAEAHYRRAHAIAVKENPGQCSAAQVGLARTLHAQNRYDEALALLDDYDSTIEIPPTLQANALRLRAAIAEAQGDLRAVIDCERRAVAIEQELLERQAEQSLRNARIMAETELLEHEAELERERRRRLERELATAVVALGDRKRQAAAVEERLRTILTHGTGNTERAVNTALREALASLRTGTEPRESVHHYLAKIDEDFQHRLRQRFPGLTRKQDRLAGLIRTGLDSKEIGSLLGLEPEGLKALRKRLRKTLGIDQDESLETFLGEI